jgi:two-component system, NarL family, nitrate/nitrite response regulator NarL
MSIRLVIADHYPLMLDGLEHLFRLEPDMAVLARCRDGEETLRAVHQHHPDILLLDLRLPRKDGLAVLQELHEQKLPTRVVVYAGELSEHEALTALRLGVKGIVLKEMDPPLLVQCVRKVHAGGQWLERQATGRVLDKLFQREAGARALTGVLTSQEIKIVQLVVSGLPTKAIAKELYISEGTAKSHLHNIYDKLRLAGRPALLHFAQANGLV